MKSSEDLVFGRGCASEKQQESSFVEENRYNEKYNEKPDDSTPRQKSLSVSSYTRPKSSDQKSAIGKTYLDEYKVGRPNCMDVEKREKLLEAYYSRPYSLRQLAVMFGVSRMTVWRVVQEFGQAPNFVL